jgi:YD repeat-containing protein
MSITLTTPFSISGPNITSETDAAAAATRYSIDALGQTITVTYPLGTATIASGKTTAFVPGLLAPSPTTIQFSLVSNTWSASNGQQGTLTAGQITAITNIMNGINNAIRNASESFAQSVGVLPGTVASW